MFGSQTTITLIKTIINYGKFNKKHKILKKYTKYLFILFKTKIIWYYNLCEVKASRKRYFMKKIITFLLLILLIPTMTLAKEAYTSETLEETLEKEEIKAENLDDYKEGENKVPIYLFRGQGCSHCHEFLEFVASDLAPEYGTKFELVSFEVWNNQNNAKFMEEVSDYLGDDASGVPYIIIGKKTFNGYSESMNDEIKSAIDDLYGSEERYDVLTEIKEHPKTKKVAKQDSSFTVVFVIFASIAVIALVVTGIKKNS